MIKNIIKQLDWQLNSGSFPENLSLKHDRFYAVNITLTKQQCLLVKNILEDVQNYFGSGKEGC